jgi:PAS domain S-box-containing protein
MMAEIDQLMQLLDARYAFVASEWQQALAPTSFVPFNSSQIHRRLLDLTQNLGAILLSEPFDPAPAQQVGQALVELHYLQPESLRQTQTVLGTCLAQGLSADQLAWLHQRLVAVLGELAQGFVVKIREVLLEEQEQIRRALEFERQQAEEETRELNKTLVRRVVERTEQLEIANQELQREVTARKRILEVLEDTTQALQTLIQASPLAIIATDPSSNIKIWNPAAERMFGWTAADIIGHPLPTVPAGGRDEFLALLKVAQQEGLANVEVRWQRKDGALIDVSVSSARVFDTHGDLTGFVTMVADLTARKQK